MLRIEQLSLTDHGVYQCIGQVGDDARTAIVSTTYLNIQCEATAFCTAKLSHPLLPLYACCILRFLPHIVRGPPVIIYDNEGVENELIFLHNSPDRPAAIQLTCRIESHPTASISWSRGDGKDSTGAQSISGLRFAV